MAAPCSTRHPSPRRAGLRPRPVTRISRAMAGLTLPVASSGGAPPGSNTRSARLPLPDECGPVPPTAYLAFDGALTIDLTFKPAAVWCPHRQDALRAHRPLPALATRPPSDAVRDRQPSWNAALRAIIGAVSARILRYLSRYSSILAVAPPPRPSGLSA